MNNTGEFALIPAKGIASGKSRLAPYLTPSNREALNRAVLRQTIAAAARFFGAEHTFVVSACTLAGELAGVAGVNFVLEQPPPGLNSALEQARHVLLRKQARMISVIPVDLPCISVGTLRRLLLPRLCQRVLIVPDRVRMGTNFLRIPADLEFPFSYGVGSFAKHVAHCRAAGIRPDVVTDSCLSDDIDDVSDLIAHANWATLSMSHPTRASSNFKTCAPYEPVQTEQRRIDP